MLSTPSPPRKIRSQPIPTSDALSSSAILNMYLPTSNEKKPTPSVEYHTSMIQSIEIVKRPLLFNQYDDDKSSRFFSSSTVTKTSVFDRINENENIVSNKDKTSPTNSNKRFKRLNTDTNNESLPQLTIQSSIDDFITPTKQTRVVLKRKSPNIEKESSPTKDQSDAKIFEHEIDNSQVEMISFLLVLLI